MGARAPKSLGGAIVLSAALAAGAPGVARAAQAEEADPLGLGVLSGIQISHEVLTGKGGTNLGASVGGYASYALTPRWSWFADGLISTIDTDIGGNALTLTARTGAELFITHRGSWDWFLSAGAGWMDGNYDVSGVDGFSRAIASGSIGQRIHASGREHLRWEVRGDLTVGDDGLDEARYMQGQVLIGWTWGGAQPARQARERQRPPQPDEDSDTDGDGVPDRRDRCPDTPSSVRVDRYGCPARVGTDGDGDGVPDSLDACPRTAAGTPVGADGCESDADRDRVPDGRDACPGTPANLPVDETGCPIDSDGDGVPEGTDLCPDTPRGAKVDAVGCRIDSDVDGVPDGIDACPNTAASALVDARGCPIDRPDRD